MRTYDPADSIVYVHLAQHPAAPATPPAHDGCHRLPTGYANASLRDALGGRRPVAARPTLAVLPGGAAAAAGPAPATPALRLVR